MLLRGRHNMEVIKREVHHRTIIKREVQHGG